MTGIPIRPGGFRAGAFGWCFPRGLCPDRVLRLVGDGRAQFRLDFETSGDNDGEADLALFFLADSNTNEPGIFTLDLK